MYNYETFTPQSYDFAKQTGIAAGDQLPAFTLTDLDGRTVQLSSFQGKTLVLETGSLTCPLYVGKIKSMNALARKYPDVQFAVIYIREAHPGRKIPAHTDADTKQANAKRLKQAEPENRVILVDDLDGSLHERLGLLPNMAFVISGSGQVLYRADWNIPDKIDEILTAIQNEEPISQTPSDFTPVAPSYSLRVLSRAGGLKAVWEFLTHLPQLIGQHKAHRKNRDGNAKP